MNTKSSWNIYRTRFLVRACPLTEPLTFTDSLGREHSGEPGDYLVETNPGIRRITARKLFEDIYVPLASPESQAQECSPPTVLTGAGTRPHKDDHALRAVA
jgi:hypothetical protein